MDAREGLKKAGQDVDAQLEVFMERVCQKIQGEAIKTLYDNDIVGHTKQLSSNIRYEITRQAGIIMGVVGTGENVPYAWNRHEGRPPGKMPPHEPILKWVIYKGLVKESSGKVSTLDRLKKRKKDPALAQAEAITWGIRKKIAAEGYEGYKFMEIALAQSVDFVASEINNLKLT